MWEHVKQEFGGPHGDQLIFKEKTHYIHVKSFLSTTSENGSFGDLKESLKLRTDHRKFELPARSWHTLLHAITSSMPGGLKPWFHRKWCHAMFKATLPMRKTQDVFPHLRPLLKDGDKDRIVALQKKTLVTFEHRHISHDEQAKKKKKFSATKHEPGTIEQLPVPVAVQQILLEGLLLSEIAWMFG